jgi:hypothetical protein
VRAGPAIDWALAAGSSLSQMIRSRTSQSVSPASRFSAVAFPTGRGINACYAVGGFISKPILLIAMLSLPSRYASAGSVVADAAEEKTGDMMK